MKIEIKFKEIGYGTNEAIIINWISDIGDMVTEKQPIVELTCDKEMFSILSPTDGVIEEIFFRAGETVTSNDVLGIIESDTEAFRNSSGD